MRLPLRHLLAALLAAIATTTAAGAASADTDCDQACQLEAAWQQQRQNALPRTAFYDAPDPLPWAPAGTLIRHAPADYTIGRATRILYHSRTSSGRDVAASGVVLVPPGTPPAGGWPVVVDAHGTSGIARDCAPSLMKDLYHGDQMTRFVEQGYAVVAPDYAGLGTTGRQEAVNKTAEANDLLYALRASRHLGLELSRGWVMWGHSQGGGATLGLAERLAHHREPGYLGAVVTSPAADLRTLIEALPDSSYLGGFVALLAQGASYSDHRIRPERLLTDEAVRRLPLTTSGCLNVVLTGYQDLTGTALVWQDFADDPAFARYLARNTTGQRPVGGPVLLLQGDADTVVPRAVTDRVASTLCGLGSAVDYRTYPGLGHDTGYGVTGIDDGAMPDILGWIQDRFAGRPAVTTCEE
ncbi:hypothetical protein GBF35_21280 [Nonomuraea phyllanthi]|uniref:lipase family protein n=1 Tax=Nonomuraea phyllanthi TaxID=2219224 RepID=UPI001293A95F|nr:lipase family protein [Nonomuraea phyllanthi]QFY08870.1 hypothetical protein GBF35_21280 [Nonomuraea phyllanthi]